MMFCDFQTRTFAKWILAGEHAVVRGKSALVFPLRTYSLQLTYFSKGPLKITCSEKTDQRLQPLFLQLLARACTSMDKDFKDLEGHFHIDSSLPSGKGMGSSAALCVAAGRFFVAQRWLEPDELYTFSKNLENNFHGISSGVDIIGVSAEQCTWFQKGVSQPVQQCWQPYWYLSYSGASAVTADCVQQVQKLQTTDQQFASRLDDLMEESVIEAKIALESTSPKRENQLAIAINKAAHCFREWGLVQENLENHMQYLSSQGALAVKPTGSGKGGYVLSLWDKALSSKENFIPLHT